MLSYIDVIHMKRERGRERKREREAQKFITQGLRFAKLHRCTHKDD